MVEVSDIAKEEFGDVGSAFRRSSKENFVTQVAGQAPVRTLIFNVSWATYLLTARHLHTSTPPFPGMYQEHAALKPIPTLFNLSF